MATPVELAEERELLRADGREVGDGAQVDVGTETDDAALVGLAAAVHVGSQLHELVGGADGDVLREEVSMLRQQGGLEDVGVRGVPIR